MIHKIILTTVTGVLSLSLGLFSAGVPDARSATPVFRPGIEVMPPGGITSQPHPSFIDIDNDNDLDLFLGMTHPSSPISYYENMGTASAPSFVRGGTGGAQPNPLAGINAGTAYGQAAPAFVDLDDDGDFDVLIGNGYGTLRYFENIGTPVTPSFIERFGSLNPFTTTTGSGISLTYRPFNVGGNSSPVFADLDSDGDQDLFVGNTAGTIEYFENTGTRSVPVFAPAGTGGAKANPFAGSNAGAFSTPSFADLDMDGDLDLFTGGVNGSIYYLENTGTLAAPVFTLGGTGVAKANPFAGVNLGGLSAPTFTDLDNDGDDDAIVGRDFIQMGSQVGLSLFYFENVTTIGGHLTLNSLVYFTGNPLTLTGSTVVSGGIAGTVVDAYVTIRTPSGLILFLLPNGKMSTLPAPYITNWTLTPASGPLLHYTFLGFEPVGVYAITGFFALPGTKIPVASLTTTGFLFVP